MEKKIKFLFTIIVVFSIFTLLFLGLSKDNYYSPLELKKKSITNFSGKDIFTEKNISLDEILNKNGYTLLNIWASWCLPCREEHKILLQLKNNKNLELIGLNYKDEVKNAKEFLINFGNPFDKIILDKDGTRSILMGAYGVPETYLIDNGEKKIVKKYIGQLNLNHLSEINKIIK